MDIPKVLQVARDAYRYAYNKDSRMSENLMLFYQEGIKNPSVSNLIAHHVTNEGIKHYGEMMQEDIGSLRGNPWQLIKNYLGRIIMASARLNAAQSTEPVKEYFEKFDAKYNKLYGKTHALRKVLIADNRVAYDKVIPRMPKSIKKVIKYAKFF